MVWRQWFNVVYWCLKCQDFLSDTDEHFKKAEVINFKVIHHNCRGVPLQKDLKTYQPVQQKKIFLSAIKSKRKIFHLPYVVNMMISLLKRQLPTNILRAYNVFFVNLYKNNYKISCFMLPCVLIRDWYLYYEV